MPLQNSMLGARIVPLAAAAIAGTLTSNLTATGTTQATALPVNDAINVITTTASSTGVIVFSQTGNYSVGDSIVVVNLGANTLNVFPPVGARFNVGSTNAAITIATGVRAIIYFISPTQLSS